MRNVQSNSTLYEPSVSVIVTVYNGLSEGLKECLKSISEQSLSKLQLIVVDDCSNDGSSEFAEDFTNSIGGTFIHHTKNKGLSASLNDGIRASYGEYILILQQDWILFENSSIKDSIKILESMKDEGILIGRQNYELKKLNFYQKFVELRLGHIYLNTIQKGQIGLTENKCDLLKRETIIKIGPFDETLRISGEDQVFSHKVADLGLPMTLSDAPMYFNTLTGENSFKGIIHKEIVYGKYSAPLFTGIYSKKKHSKNKTNYIKVKIRNRIISVTVTLLVIISFLSSLILNNIDFLMFLVIGTALRGIFITKELKILKKNKIILQINIILSILLSVLLDILYTVYFAYGIISNIGKPKITA